MSDQSFDLPNNLSLCHLLPKKEAGDSDYHNEQRC
jgi:hypothetical protein